MREMTWFRFSQNNSYGRFDVSADLAPEVYIEATDADAANKRALGIGIYFDDQCNTDCPCCGSRWSEAAAWTDSGPLPVAYGDEITSPEFWKNTAWRQDTRVHFADGRVLAIRSLAEAMTAFPVAEVSP